MHSILPAILYVLILAGCGFLFSRLLRSESVYGEFGLTFTFGTALFLLLANGFGYVMPIQQAFTAALASIGLLDVVLLYLFYTAGSPRRPSSDPDDDLATFFLLFLTGLVGFAGARYIGSDPWSWQHFPLASTIVEGNFPVHSPIDPESLLHYHYAPAFLAAGFRLLTGLPLTVGFALQPLLGAGGILFFSAALVRRHRSTRTALFAALLALAGSGLVWLKLPELHALALGVFGQTPLKPAFAGLANLVGTPITTSPLVFLGHRSTATGFPLLYGLLYALSCALNLPTRTRRILHGALVFLFALALTLTMEIGFVTVSAAALVVAALFLVQFQSRSFSLRLIGLGLFALLPALLIALVHGGVLSGLLGARHGSFVFHPSFSVIYDTYGNTASLFSARFLRDFGVPLFLFPFAAFVAWRSRRTEPVWFFLCTLAAIHFVLPFLFDYQLIRGEMHRIFYGATSLMAMLAGVWICDMLLDSLSFLRRMPGWILLVSMLVSGAIYLALRLVIPTMRFVPAPLFAPMPVITAEQSALYDWVRSHTALSDFFYVRNLTVHFETITDEATVQMRDRILFTTYTGRFTVGPIIYWDYRPAWLEDAKKAEETCRTDLMRRLRVRYLLVETPDRASWFVKHCRSADWHAVYEAEGGRLPKVYELQREKATI